MLLGASPLAVLGAVVAARRFLCLSDDTNIARYQPFNSLSIFSLLAVLLRNNLVTVCLSVGLWFDRRSRGFLICNDKLHHSKP